MGAEARPSWLGIVGCEGGEGGEGGGGPMGFGRDDGAPGPQWLGQPAV